MIDSGLLKQAVGRGFRDPSNRVIQNHFAKSGNLGEIAAKVLAISVLSLIVSSLSYCSVNFVKRQKNGTCVGRKQKML